MNNPSVRRHSDLLKILRPAKEAAAQTAAVPEKDPADKGTAPAPTLPADKKDQSGVPDGTVNVDKTPANPVIKPDATVSAPEKAAALAARAGAVVSTLQNLLKKQADKSPASADPAAPKDDKNKPTPAPNAEGKAAEAAAPKDPKEKAPEAPKTDAKPEAVPGEKAANEVVDINPENLRDFYAKCATTAMQFEDGRAMLEQCMRREFGMQQADDIIKAAMFAEEQALALNQAELEGATAAEELLGSANDQDIKVASEIAALQDADFQKLASDEERAAYFEGVKLAAQVADAMAEGANPDEMAAPPEGPEAGGGEGEVTPEDILQVVEYLLSNGQITEEEAQQILQSLQGGAEGGDPGAEGAGGPPMGEEEMKEASVRDAAFKASQALVDAALAA